MDVIVCACDVEDCGLKNAVLIGLLRAEGKGAGAMTVAELSEKAQAFGLDEDDITRGITLLEQQGRIASKAEGAAWWVPQPREDFPISETTARRLRQYGFSADRVRQLKCDYLDSNPAEPEETDFVKFILSRGEQQRDDKIGWTPGTLQVRRLMSEGIPEEFVQQAIEPFQARYDEARGGGDLERNFDRFVKASWSKAQSTIPDGWLPSSEVNQNLMSSGLSQARILNCALEFRLWAKETARTSDNWDKAFEQHAIHRFGAQSANVNNRKLSIDSI